MKSIRLGSFSLGIAMVTLAFGSPVLAAGTAPAVPQNDDLDAVLWDQTAVEAQAASIGAYDLGEVRLDQALVDKSWTAATEQTGNYEALGPGGDPRCR